nr:glycoside hydrolase family 3 C-terminal domain-containing protein [Pedobacter sp. ASV19]
MQRIKCSIKITKKCTALLLILLFLLAKTQAQEKSNLYDSRIPFAQRVATLVSQMTLEEKISQMQYLSPAITRLGVPAYTWWNEALHGIGFDGEATSFPQAIGMAATWEPALIHTEADIISTEGRAKYYNSLINKVTNHFGGLPGLSFWSPNINIFRDPRWGRGQETYGEDPYLTSCTAVAFITGIQGNDKRYFKAIATPKHYAVHSGPEVLRHKFDAETSNRDLFETYLPAFKAAIQDGHAWSIMGAYNAFRGIPLCADSFLLTDILRKKWGFNGYVVSDCGAISNIYDGHKYIEDKALACAAAVKAGCDLTCGDEYVPNLKIAVEKGHITEKEIDIAVTRLFMARMKLGLFDADSLVPYSSIGPNDFDKENARKLARIIADKSIVLLKNNQLLPLSKSKLQKVAVIGPYINREDVLLGNYHGLPSQTVTFLQGIINAIGKEKIVSAEGISPYDNYTENKNNPYNLIQHKDVSDAAKQKLHDEAISVAKQADVIIAYMGISSNLESEESGMVTDGFDRGDRTNIDLPKEQTLLLKELKATGKPIVLVLTSGSALAINWEKQNIPAIVQAWYPGQEGGDAVADVLFGKYNPAGRLPITYYKSLADLPDFENYSMANRTYRYFKGEALFPFGYGLSYTSFKYSNLQLSKSQIRKTDSILVQVTVKNTGSYDGDEVVQLYTKKLHSAEMQPNKSLRGFQRIFIKKGASKIVKIKLKADDLKFFDEAKNDFIVEPGDYQIQIGASSADIRLTKELSIIK